jgi:acetylornithine deacetylase
MMLRLRKYRTIDMRTPAAVLALLDRLVAFRTVAGGSNLDLIDWAQAHLESAGFAVERLASPCGAKAGLLARFGTGDGGRLFSAHTDVVPVEGQAWTGDPFRLRREGDRLLGRGTADMKGFLACLLALADSFGAAPPDRPVLFALSWDEELGCRGIPHMIDRVIPALGRPDLCIVGEPTSLRLAVGHKGKVAYRAACHGEAGHSAMAPRFANAIHLAADLIGALGREQDRLAREGARDPDYDIPFSTVHAGLMRGGTALNIVPDRAEVEFEIRHLAAEDPAAILANIAADVPPGVEIEQVNAYPGLHTDPTHPALDGLLTLLGETRTAKVSFGTEAGFFSALGLPTVVCGPGDMAQGHQPDEFIALDQLVRCSQLLERLVAEKGQTHPAGATV